LAFTLFGKKPEKKPEKPAAPKVEARRPGAPVQRGPEPSAPSGDEGASLDFTSYAPPASSQASPFVAPRSVVPPVMELPLPPVAKAPPAAPAAAPFVLDLPLPPVAKAPPAAPAAVPFVLDLPLTPVAKAPPAAPAAAPFVLELPLPPVAKASPAAPAAAPFVLELPLPPVAKAPSAAPAAAPANNALGLDFGALAAQVAPRAAPPPPPPAKPAAKPVEAKKTPKRPVDSILCIEVEEGSGHDIPPAIEEAAILFANGQTEEALARTKRAIESEDVGAWKLQVWLMMFDLLHSLGRKAEFEEKSLDFVVKFERSPPVWLDAPTAAAGGDNPELRTGGLAHMALSGVLGAQSAAALGHLKKAAERQPKLRLDFAKLQSIEPAGCTLLRDALRAFKTAKKDIYITGEDRAFKLLREAAKAGDQSVDTTVWMLLLDLYQLLGLQNEFEEAAVDYAVTYEVSPPSWETPPPRPKPLGVSQPIAVRPGDDAFHVVGEVAGQSDQLFTDIAAYAGGANPVTLDFAAARRIDFVNAGRLLNVLEKQKAAAKSLVIRGAGEMIIALFAVMGITKMARIIPRK